VTHRVLRVFKEIHTYGGPLVTLQGPIIPEPSETAECMTQITRRAMALKQLAEDIIVKIFMICGPDPSNFVMQTGSSIASACMVRAQNRFAILSPPTDGGDRGLCGNRPQPPAA